MSAPIQEPLTQRSIAYGAWRTNQLERRPPPPVETETGTVPWARIAKPFDDGTFYPNQTIANNSNVLIDFDLEYNLASGDSGFDYFDATGGPPVNGIRFLVQGLFAITAEIYWDGSAANFPWQMSLSGDGANWTHDIHTGYQDALGAQSAQGTGTMIHRFEALQTIQLVVYQRSGGNRIVEAVYMEAVYLGGWTGVAPDDSLPDQ
jgi:hypothetical protein